MGRQEWIYIEEKHFSLVTEFDLDCERKSIVTLVMAIFFIGWGIGAMVSGSIADRYGRKVVFFPSLSTIFLLGIASPFVGNVRVVVAFRFLIGFAFPSIVIQSSVFLTEFVGGSFRHIYLAIQVGTANIAWIVLGMKAFYIQNWKYLSIVCIQNWKYLSIVCTAPYVFTLFKTGNISLSSALRLTCSPCCFISSYRSQLDGCTPEIATGKPSMSSATLQNEK